MHFLYFRKINATPDNALQYMTVLQHHGCQKYTGTVPTKKMHWDESYWHTIEQGWRFMYFGGCTLG